MNMALHAHFCCLACSFAELQKHSPNIHGIQCLGSKWWHAQWTTQISLPEMYHGKAAVDFDNTTVCRVDIVHMRESHYGSHNHATELWELLDKRSTYMSQPHFGKNEKCGACGA